MAVNLLSLLIIGLLCRYSESCNDDNKFKCAFTINNIYYLYPLCRLNRLRCVQMNNFFVLDFEKTPSFNSKNLSFSQVAEMMKYLREELLAILEEKIRDPCLNLLHHENGNRIIKTIINLISKDN